MKTNELIRQLQEADPSGELDCSVHNADIHFVGTEPAYWDGCYQRLRRDPDCQYYNITGADYIGTGTKLKIHLLTVSDMLLNHHDAPVGYIGVSEHSRVRYAQRVNEQRELLHRMAQNHQNGYFAEYLVKRLGCHWNEDFDEEEVKRLALAWAEDNLPETEPIPQDIPVMGDSWVGRRQKQWDRDVEVGFKAGQLVLKKAS